MATTFIAIYRGQTVGDAQLIAVSADPALVADVSERLLATRTPVDHDPAVTMLERGRRGALQLIKQQADNGRR